MKETSTTGRLYDRAIRRQNLLRVNIAMGILIFVIAMLLSLIADYQNPVDYREAERIYNYMAFGGTLYSAVAWLYCALRQPHWFAAASRNKQSSLQS